MYRSFLSWEIGVRKMALFIREDDRWVCASTIGISPQLLQLDIESMLPQFTKVENLYDEDHPLIREFDVVIPVRHKDLPISYVFIGGFSEDEDMFNKTQFGHYHYQCSGSCYRE